MFALAETRSVDDQVEWLDAKTVLYSVPHALTGTPATDTYTVPADGGGKPSVFVCAAPGHPGWNSNPERTLSEP